MDGEEETSWLSIVIDRVDKLALSIGGYEDEAPGKQNQASARDCCFFLLCCLSWNTSCFDWYSCM